MKTKHKPRRAAKSRVFPATPKADPPRARLDWSDPSAVRRLLIDLRRRLKDMRAVVKDMLARKRDRNLGHRQHRQLHDDAYGAALADIAYAMPLKPTPPIQ
jgi:hypothetical protein